MLSGNPRNQKETVVGDGFHQRLPQQIEMRPKQKQLIEELELRNNELTVLNAVNTRLGQQLIILLDKLGVSHQSVVLDLQRISEPSAAFHFEQGQLQYLDALLISYDDSNLTQKKMIGKLYSQLTEMEKRAESLVKENAFLMEELESKCKTVLQIYSNGFPEQNLAGIYSQLQNEDMESKLALMKEENEYLKNNFREAELKLGQLQDAATTSAKQATSHFENYKKQSDQLQDALMKLEDVGRINDVLKRKFDQVTEENNTLEAKKYDLEAKVARMDNQLKLIRAQLLTVKRAQGENTSKFEERVEILNQELEVAQKREKEYFNKSLAFQKELEVTRQTLRKTRREHEQTKKDLEQTLQMLQTYELKISNYVRKEEAVERLAKENRDKIESALLERDKAMLKQQQLTKLLDSQAAKQRDQQRSTAESYEKVIKSLNEKVANLQDALDQEESAHQHSRTMLESQIEKYRRQATQLRDQNSKFMNSLKTGHSQQLANRLKDLQQRNESLKRLLEQQERTSKDDNEDKMETIRRLEAQNRQYSRQLQKEKASIRQKQGDRTALKSKLNMVSKERDSLLEELERLRKNYDLRIANFQSDQSSKSAEVQHKLAEATKRERALKQNTIKLLQEFEQKEDKLKFELIDRIKTLELENQTLKSKLYAKLNK